MGTRLILALVLAGPAGAMQDLCPACHADRAALGHTLADLAAPKWRHRDRAASDLGAVRWQCHPEVVAALVGTLREDGKPSVRAEAAESLGRLVVNLPTSHVALDEAARLDPDSTVRKRAKQALAANGLRCSTDCPLCGPLPTGPAINGPAVLLPERANPPRPSTEPTPAGSSLPPALPPTHL